MAKDISISIASETRAFQKGIKDGIIEPLDGAVESIEDFGKAGDKSGAKLEDSMKDAQKKTEDLGDEYEQLRKKIDQVGKQGQDSFKKVKDGTDGASAGVKDLKEESVSTAKEAAASFDGSAASIIDAFQEVAANAFIGFGAAGGAAGLALAGGIGIAVAAFQATQEDAQKAKDRISELGTALIEAADNGMPIETVAENLKNMAVEAQGVRKPLKDIRKEAQDLGLDFESLATAYAGGTDELDTQIQTLEILTKQGQDAHAAQMRGEGEWSGAQEKRLDAMGDQLSKLKDVQAETQAAQQQEQDWLAAGGAEMLAKADAIDNINSSYDDAVFAVEDFVNKETGVLDVDAYVASMDARAKSLQDYQSNLATSGLTTEQKAALNDMGVEAAAKWLDGYKNTSEENKTKMRGYLTEAAKDSSGSAKKELEKAFENPVQAKVKADLDALQAQRDLDNLIKARTAIIKVDFVNKYGKSVDG